MDKQVDTQTGRHFPSSNTTSKHTYIALNLSDDSCSIFVDDGVNLLNDVEVGLVVGVLDTCPSPGDVGELTSG